jgi:hypothetical protein
MNESLSKATNRLEIIEESFSIVYYDYRTRLRVPPDKYCEGVVFLSHFFRTPEFSNIVQKELLQYH